jgi:hypothetical protein
MVSIAVETLQGGRAVAIGSLATTPHGDIKSIFAHSLFANGVESVPQPAAAEMHSKEKAATTEGEVSKKGDTTNVDAAVAQSKFMEIEPGPSNSKANAKPLVSSNVTMAKGRPAAKSEPVSKVKEVRTAEVKKAEVSKPVIGPATVNSTVATNSPAHINNKAATNDAAVDKTETTDGESVASLTSLTPESEVGVLRNGLKDAESQPLIPSGAPVSEKNNESVPPALPVATVAAQHTINPAPADAGHLVKMPEGADDTSATVIAKVEQTKSGAGVVSADLAANGFSGVGKSEAGIGAIAAVLHGDAGSQRQDGASSSHGNERTGNLESTAHQGSVSELTPSLNSHNAAYGDEHGSANEARPGLLAATPTSLEVGIANGTHGWLKIRAEMEGGVVTASVSSGSVAGQEMLHRELPSLAAYLQDEKVSVNALVVKQTTAADMSGANSDSYMQRQGQPSQQSSNRSNGGMGIGDKSGWGGPVQETMYEVWNGFGSGGGFLPVTAGGNGSWLNVRV